MGDDEAGKRTLHVLVAEGNGGDTSFTVTYGRKR